MGGWLLVSGNSDSLDEQIRNFERRFTVPGVNCLNLEKRSYGEDLQLLLWSWSEPLVPDAIVSSKNHDNEILVLHGVITDLGQFASAKIEQLQIGLRLLDLWEEYGHKLIPELNGSFSCACVNMNDKSITMFTDRFASRPVWISKENSAWYVGNFPSALAAIRKRPPKLNGAGLWSLFANSRHIGRQGLYEGFINLQAGECAQIKKNGGLSISKWYERRYTPQVDIPAKEWGKLIANALCTSAKRINAVTESPHLFLSGGMDSRVAVSAIGDNLRTVTLSSHPNMNSRIANKVARILGCDHQTIIREPYWYLDSFEAAALLASGNYNIRHAHFIQPIRQITKEIPNAAFLLGDLLENFNKHYFRIKLNGKRSLPPEKVPDIFHQLYAYSHKSPEHLRKIFQENVVDLMIESWRQNMIDWAEKVWSLSGDIRDCADSLFRWNNCSMCPTYLMLECVHPLAAERNLMLDNDLAELMLQLPADLRGAGVIHNWILWCLNKHLVFIPNSNFWLPPIAPKKVEKLAKKIRPLIGKARRGLLSIKHDRPVVKTEGSWHMLNEWYRKDMNYKEYIESCLFNPFALPPEIFNVTEIKTRWQEFLAGNLDGMFEIDMLLSFGLLHRKILTDGLQVC